MHLHPEVEPGVTDRTNLGVGTRCSKARLGVPPSAKGGDPFNLCNFDDIHAVQVEFGVRKTSGFESDRSVDEDFKRELASF